MTPSPPTNTEIASLIEQELGVPALQIESLRSGAWSAASAVTTSLGEWVVRFAKTPDDFLTDSNASRFAGINLPIPKVHGIGQLDTRWWCISDRMPGKHLDELSPDDWELTLPSLAKMLVAIRDADSAGTTGFGGWDAHGNGLFPSFADQLLDVAVDNPDQRGGGWGKTLAANPYEQSVFTIGLMELRRLCAFLPNVRQLIHQDTINYNITVENHEISGIFDWGCAMWGDAIYDLAWFRFWNPWYPERSHLHIPDRLESMVGIQGEHAAERMRCCLLHIGLMHIRYNAFIGDLSGMNDVAKETEKLLQGGMQ